ncbi:MAG: lactam utilization protein LamB [Desulfobacterales bacterium GWB2_56_26]|nr:MAG: lactam utilization protein LamB [Desulfobacterales bacterium GWB2_56_26]
MNKKTIDLNCDLGESFGVYKLGMDEEVMPYITSANIACGWHAGDPLVMNKTVKLAAQHGINCGAHPGYPDLLGFGRRAMKVGLDELKCYLIYQIGALDAFCRASGVKLTHVKPHGSLYLTAVESEETAMAVAEAIGSVGRELIFVTLAGQKGQVMAEAGRRVGLAIAYEAFPDRAYTPEGTLVPRQSPGAVITDPEQVMERAVQIATEGCIEAVNGERIELAAQTLCVHGDNPHAVEMVRTIRRELEQRNIDVRPMHL